MKQELIFNYMKKQGAKPKKELIKSDFCSINTSFANFFQCELFEFYLELFEIKKEDNLPEIFWYEASSTDFNVVLSVDGKFKSVNGKSTQVTPEELVGTLAYTIKKRPKKQTTLELYKQLITLSPKVSYFAIALVIFGVLTPFYSNMFNSRLVYNDSVMTFVIVTAVFVMIYMLELVLKSVIKKRSLIDIESNFRQLSDYFLLLFRDSKANNISVKVRALEQSSIYVWENFPQLFVDVSLIVLYSGCMWLLLNQYFGGLFIYYILLSAVMYYVRFSAYKNLIESFKFSNDKSTFSYSVESKRYDMMFANFDDLSKVFSGKYLADEVNRKSLDLQNHHWSELIRFNTFVSIVVMFFCCFVAIKANAIEISSVIAIMIVNSRLSSSISGVINRVYQLKVKRYHFFQSADLLFKEMNTKEGVTIDSVDKVEIKNLSLPVLKSSFGEPLNYQFEKGKTYAFRGASGSGKTTLLNVLGGLNTHYEGEVLYNDLSLRELSQESYGNLVGYHTAKTDFVQSSLIDNFNFYGIYDVKDIVAIIKNSTRNFPITQENLSIIEANYLPLSNGEKQKMLLLMSIFKKPKLIILDESMSFMSKADAISTYKFIREANPQAIIVFASQDDKLSQFVDNTINFEPKPLSNKVILNI